MDSFRGSSVQVGAATPWLAIIFIDAIMAIISEKITMALRKDDALVGDNIHRLHDGDNIRED